MIAPLSKWFNHAYLIFWAIVIKHRGRRLNNTIQLIVFQAANTATATFYLLAKNPEKQDKLREEILAKEGKQSYLKACIKESMRLLPVVNGNLRKTTKEYNLLGYKIPKDVRIIHGVT